MAKQVNLADTRVMIAMPVYGSVPPATVQSLVKTASECAARGVRVDFTMEVSGIVTMGRDALLDDFLRSDADKLFWIDSDMVWEPADFLRLVALSTKVDVVGAAYPTKVDGPTSFQVAMDANPVVGDYGLVPVNGLGLGFTVVDRSVAQQLADNAPKVRNCLNGRELAQVFRVDSIDGDYRSEDMAFFADIRDLGYAVWIDPQITLGHVGSRQWRGRIADAFQSNATEYIEPTNRSAA